MYCSPLYPPFTCQPCALRRLVGWTGAIVTAIALLPSRLLLLFLLPFLLVLLLELLVRPLRIARPHEILPRRARCQLNLNFAVFVDPIFHSAASCVQTLIVLYVMGLRGSLGFLDADVVDFTA